VSTGWWKVYWWLLEEIWGENCSKISENRWKKNHWKWFVVVNYYRIDLKTFLVLFRLSLVSFNSCRVLGTLQQKNLFCFEVLRNRFEKWFQDIWRFLLDWGNVKQSNSYWITVEWFTTASILSSVLFSKFNNFSIKLRNFCTKIPRKYFHIFQNLIT
jgi:hypothetical protein